MKSMHNIEDEIENNQSSWDAFEKRVKADEERRIKLRDEELDNLLGDLKTTSADDLPLKENPLPVSGDSETGVIIETSPAIVDEIIAPAVKYEFPIPKLDLYKDWKSEDILNNLDSLSQSAKKTGQYLLVRKAFCALSIELNSRKLIAPAFRPSPTIPRGINKFSADHCAIQRDRLVIDCHWLHSRNEWVSVSENKWRGLLDSRKDFQYEKINEFVSTSIKNEYRADAIFRLTPRQQYQLAALRGNKTRMQFDKLVTSEREKGKSRTPPRLETIELGINQWCERDSRVEKYRHQYFAIAKAVELLGDGATTKHIAELTGLILGERPLSERSILTKRNKLKRWLPT